MSEPTESQRREAEEALDRISESNKEHYNTLASQYEKDEVEYKKEMSTFMDSLFRRK